MEQIQEILTSEITVAQLIVLFVVHVIYTAVKRALGFNNKGPKGDKGDVGVPGITGLPGRDAASPMDVFRRDKDIGG